MNLLPPTFTNRIVPAVQTPSNTAPFTGSAKPLKRRRTNPSAASSVVPSGEQCPALVDKPDDGVSSGECVEIHGINFVALAPVSVTDGEKIALVCTDLQRFSDDRSDGSQVVKGE
jgi:hypothetical protein